MQQHFLTVSAMAVLLLGACYVWVSSNSEVVSTQKSTVNSLEAAPHKEDGIEATVDLALEENADGAEIENLDVIEQASLPEFYRGLNPQDISRSEIDELLTLQKAARQLYQERLSDWRSQDIATRGPEPKGGAIAVTKEGESRLKLLNTKFHIAMNRQRYETYGPAVFSKEEVNELIVLERKQAKSRSEGKDKYQKELEIWEAQDPVIRGEKPSMDRFLFSGLNTRLIELQEKARHVDDMNRLRRRIKILSSKHNVMLLDSDISEWSDLQQESSRLELDLLKAIETAQSEKQFPKRETIKDSEVVKNIVADPILRHKMQRAFQIEKRIDGIEAPLKAAEIADKTRSSMRKLSEESGVSVSSREIRETIDLKVELDRIETQTRFEVQEKLVEEGELFPEKMPQPNAKDVARITEIKARIKEISAPMDEALSELK